ncbi:hypothetical protein ASPCAL12376 [Aspergillus calidoustus]|uniref:Uncharacterized protein n=1 Tax=Aspergillus calidoustus TaxID=454130 RepID=A0A0U4ZHT9_ASPCI|nr:hypothetical protein ASPCAL12376 [Aspergillus calidoustus]
MRPRATTIPLHSKTPCKLSTVINRSGTTTPDSTLHDDFSRVYTIFQSLKPNYTIVDDEGLPVYYVKTKGLRPTAPHLTMHPGKDASGPIVAFVKFIASSRTAKIARGDPEYAQNAIWEDLKRLDRWSGVRYRWEMAVLDYDGAVQRKTFVWKRTRSFNADGLPRESKNPFRRNYKLVDGESGELLAVFSADLGLGNFKQLGKLRFMDDRYGSVFRMMVSLSALVVCDWED